MKIEWERFPLATHFTKIALGSCDYWQVEGGKILRQWVQLGTGGDFGEVPREHIRETPFRMPVMHERASAVWDGEGRPRAGVLIEMKHKDATGPAEIADVLSHMITLCDDMAEAKNNQQKALWAIDAKVAMNKGFALINEMVVERAQLKAEVANLEHQSASLIKIAKQANQLSSDVLDERNQARAEVEALRKDAERYRFIVDCPIRTVVVLGRLAAAADFDLSAECDRIMTKGDV